MGTPSRYKDSLTKVLYKSPRFNSYNKAITFINGKMTKIYQGHRINIDKVLTKFFLELPFMMRTQIKNLIMNGVKNLFRQMKIYNKKYQ